MSDSVEEDAAVETIIEIASDIAKHTRLSEKQATALLLREVLKTTNQRMAEVLEVGSPASASSYVTRCRSKFDSVEEEIDKLEQRIEEWEKTQQLKTIIDRFDAEHTEAGLQQLSETIQEEIVDSEDEMYLIAYVDQEGDERVQSVNMHPRNIDNREVLRYKRISSTDEVFE